MLNLCASAHIIVLVFSIDQGVLLCAASHNRDIVTGSRAGTFVVHGSLLDNL